MRHASVKTKTKQTKNQPHKFSGDGLGERNAQDGKIKVFLLTYVLF